MKDIQKIKEIMSLFMQLDEVDRQTVKEWINIYQDIYENLYEKLGLVDKISGVNIDIDWDKYKYKFNNKCYENAIVTLEEE